MPREDSDRERRRRSSRDPESDREKTKDADRQQRRRRTHRATDSQGELLPKHGSSRDHSASTPRSSRPESSSASSKPLRLGSLAQLDAVNAKKGWSSRPGGYDEAYLQEVREGEARLEKERRKEERATERERRRAARAEAEEEERRLEELEQQRAERAARHRPTEDEREQRREEKRRQRRDEKERQRQLELEEQDAPLQTRERERELEGERLRLSKAERERERRRREYDTGRETEHEYTSSDERRKTGYRDERRRKPKYAELPPESPNARETLREKSPRKKTRVISGPYLEDGRSEEVYEYRKDKLTVSDVSGPTATTTDSMWTKKRNKRIAIYVAVFIVLLLIIIPVGVVLSKKPNSKSTTTSSFGSNSGTPPKSELSGLDHSSIPSADWGTYYDPWSWYDTANFNVSYTKETVGGLPVMGLNSTWDDSVQANSKVPALKDAFAYGSMPVRGMNIGGWLSLEPWITPSVFARFNQKQVIDEYTLCQALGGSAASTLESHYSSFVNFQTFADIRAAGFDHVRIPFSYWAVTTYDGDPYVKQISWRYLLRAIEWARQNGIRVNLDLHGLPGSQNGWNHSGRQGYIGWLNGTDGTLNGQRSLDIHGQLSTFFGQPRYQNVVTMYGLCNEPRMTGLDTSLVLDWTTKAVAQIRKNNVSAIITFGDGFMGLDNWQGKLQMDDRLLLDVHQYVIFNTDLLQMTHSKKLNFACAGWQAQMTRSQNKATGFGPTMCGEWSQADTDCAPNLNNVGMGNRWQGTLMTGNASTEVLQPFCPLKTSNCDCTNANADPSKYSDTYKQWLLAFATAQMESFEFGWGWFYWTWQTESAVQWSWKAGAQAGILPKTVWDRAFSCNNTIPDFGKLGLAENY